MAPRPNGRGRIYVWSKADVLNLLKMFEGHKELWDPNCKLYSDRAHKSVLMDRIAEQLGIDQEEVSSKLHNLRCQYNSVLRTIRNKKMQVPPRWEYYDAMKFLSQVSFVTSKKDRRSAINGRMSTREFKAEPMDETNDLLNPLALTVASYADDGQPQRPEISAVNGHGLANEAPVSEHAAGDARSDVRTDSTCDVPVDAPADGSAGEGSQFDGDGDSARLRMAVRPARIVNRSFHCQHVESDEWNALGHLIAANARSWSAESKVFARRYKAALSAVNAQFEAEAIILSEHYVTNDQDGQ